MRKAVTAAGLALLVAGCGRNTDASGESTPLVGTFRLAPGSCASGPPTGTYFRLILPGGTVEHGRYFRNPDSACSDKTFTLVRPGRDGGLDTGTFQPNPARPFDAGGGALAARIAEPESLAKIKFAVSTNRTDPQTGTQVDAPQIVTRDGRLSGQVTAWSAAWNNVSFNQGSPKPGGATPGLTTPASGTYDPPTQRFVLTWTSQIVGGPFNGFAGYWHLEGTFRSAN